MSNIKVIRPQKGPQEKFLSTTADIAIYGGAAGGGKSYGLLIEPLRYKNNKRFGAVIFRHEYKQIFNQGGLWDTSNDVYGDIKGADGRYSAGMAIIRISYMTKQDTALRSGRIGTENKTCRSMRRKREPPSVTWKCNSNFLYRN